MYRASIAPIIIGLLSIFHAETGIALNGGVLVGLIGAVVNDAG